MKYRIDGIKEINNSKNTRSKVNLKYFKVNNGPLNNGVIKKVFFSTSTLAQLDVDIELILIGNGTSFESKNFTIRHESIDESKFLFKNKLYIYMMRQYYITKILKKYLHNLDKNDMLYIRYPYPIFFFVSGYTKNSVKCKIITEHNAIEPKEFLLGKGYIQFLIDLLFGKRLRSFSDAFVGVTEEITMYQLSRLGTNSIPSITIGNGFDVNSVPIRQAPLFSGEELHILFIGSTIHQWHGIDRFLQGLEQYSGNIKIHFHIVGNCHDRQHHIKINGNESHYKIYYHGFLSGEQLDSIFDQCHLALGSLGMHRKGLLQTSELKIREYCVRGIPFILSSKDRDFDENFNYCYYLPPMDFPINLEQIIEFAYQVCPDLQHPKKMREYATNNLDWSVKMRTLKHFLENLP